MVGFVKARNWGYRRNGSVRLGGFGGRVAGGLYIVGSVLLIACMAQDARTQAEGTLWGETGSPRVAAGRTGILRDEAAACSLARTLFLAIPCYS